MKGQRDLHPHLWPRRPQLNKAERGSSVLTEENPPAAVQTSSNEEICPSLTPAEKQGAQRTPTRGPCGVLGPGSFGGGREDGAGEKGEQTEELITKGHF